MKCNEEHEKISHKPTQHVSIFTVIFVTIILIFQLTTIASDLQLRFMGNSVTGHIIEAHYGRGGVWLTVKFETNGRRFIERVRGATFSPSAFLRVKTHRRSYPGPRRSPGPSL